MNPGPARRGKARLALASAAVAALAAGCGGAEESEPSSGEDAFTEIQRQAEQAAAGEPLAAPRWEPISTMSGAGDETVPFEVSARAIQWRARWSCKDDGGFEMEVDGAPLGSGRCPGEGEAAELEYGPHALGIAADGPWRLVIEQQVDTALREPPLPEVASGEARLLAAGRFRPIENPGRGDALLYALPSGRLALRLRGFLTSSNTDLFVWLSESRLPRTTRQALAAPHVEIAPLKSTVGDQNYVLPEGFDAADARSVVIWCEPIRVAYTAAPLRP